MDKEHLSNIDHETKRVMNLLTPRYSRKNKVSFVAPHRNIMRGLRPYGWIAAIFMIVVAVGIRTALPVSATRVVKTALAKLNRSDNIRIEFSMRAVRTDADEIYSPDPTGELINGTAFIKRKDGMILNRIDWHDAEQNSIMFTGADYIHLKNGIVVDAHPSKFKNELIDIVNLNTLAGAPEKIIDESEISDRGQYIDVNHMKDNISFTGQFSKADRSMTRAIVTADIPQQGIVKLLETSSINTDIIIPDTIFSK